MDLEKPKTKFMYSEPVETSKCDLFTVPPTQLSVNSGTWDEIVSYNNIKDDYIRFDIEKSPMYMDLCETEFHVFFKIVNPNDTAKHIDNATTNDSAKRVTVANNLMHSIFKQLIVYINDKPVENTNENYAYKAYIENLLTFNKETKNTILWREGFVHEENTSNNINSFVGKGTDDEILNKGAAKRYELVKGGRTVHLVGKLHADIFNLDRYMLGNVKISIVLKLASPSFYLKGETVADFTDRKVVLERTFLKVRRVDLSVKIREDHISGLIKNGKALYPFRRVEIKAVSNAGQHKHVEIVNFNTGPVPSRVLVGFVKPAAYSGDHTENPFNFINMGITDMVLQVGGKYYPYSTPLKMDFDKDNYWGAYNTIVSNIKNLNGISYESYKNGNTLFAFDMTPDLSNVDHYSNSLPAELTLNFDRTSEDAFVAIFYLEFDSILEIDKDGNTQVITH